MDCHPRGHRHRQLGGRRRGGRRGHFFAALIVLPAMGLPVTLVALLISVEPLIDMGRTALNVNGSMTAGTLTSQWLRQTDKSIFDSEEEAELAHR